MLYILKYVFFIIRYSNVIDLVTDKEKQIQSGKYKIAYGKLETSVFGNSDDDNYDFDDQKGDANTKINGQIMLQKSFKKEEIQSMLHIINRMFAKNKINGETAFNFPILSVDVFTNQSQSEKDKDIAWSKMSSIVENDYKIYGCRVDTFTKSVQQLSDSLGRKSLQNNNMNQIQKQVQEENKIQMAEKGSKSELFSSDMKNNLMLHLERNSENLNINLQTKLSLRKNPLFERTCRKFDHSSYNSLFLNTLQFTNNFWIQINEEQQIKDSFSKKKQNCQSRESEDNYNNDQQTGYQYFSNVLDQIISRKVKMQFQSCQEIEIIRNQFEGYGIQIYPEGLNIVANQETILDMILKGQLKSAFEFGGATKYDSSQSQVASFSSQQPSEYQQIYDQNENLRFKANQDQNVKLQGPIPDERQKQQRENRHQNRYQKKEEIENILEDIERKQRQGNLGDRQKITEIKKTGGKTKNMKMIKDVISLKVQKQKKQGKKQEKKQGKPVSRGEKKKKKVEQKDKYLFDPLIKQNFKTVIKKEKNLKIVDNFDDIILERNLISSNIGPKFEIFHPTQLRPIQAQKASILQQIQNGQGQWSKKLKRRNPRRLNEQNVGEYLIESQGVQRLMSMNEDIRNQTITNIKQNIYIIIKELRRTDSECLYAEYIRRYKKVDKSSIFLGMLHLANERYIKAKQVTKKIFHICLFELND